jgi:hypothetical protein
MKRLFTHLLCLAALLVLAIGTAHAAIDPATVQKLLADDVERADLFGISVAVSGDTAVIAAACDDSATGAAYVFIRTGSVWSQQQKLTAADGAAYKYFGQSVAVSGDTAVIGATREDIYTGSAYVFTRTGGVWSQQQKLLVGDGTAGDYFGHSVAVSGDTAVVGASYDNNKIGSAYVFTRAADGTWSQQAKLTAADGAANDHFGCSVSVFGNTVVIGASYDDTQSGAAYVFTRTGGVWSQQQKLTADTRAVGDVFGQSVSVSGETAVVGAYYDDDKVGSAYVFTRTADSTWSQQAKLTADDGAALDRFGWSVSVSGDMALIGAFGDDSVKGSAYVFTRTGGVWSQQQKLLAGDGAAADEFGQSVSVSGDTAVIGALGNDDKGAAYVFGSNPSVTAPHINLAPIYKLLLKGRGIDAPCPSCPYPGEM